MLGDVLLIEEKHKNVAHEIVQKYLKTRREKLIITIGGESGSGKSEVAHMVGRYLKKEGILTKILHTDNYYRIPPNNRLEWRKKEGISAINFTEYDWDLIIKNILDFKSDKVGNLPCVDLINDRVDTLITDFSGISVLILEGLYSLHFTGDFNIYIDLTYHETKKAQSMRGKEIYDDFRMKVLEREHKIVSKFRSEANYIISKQFSLLSISEK
ncbi:Uridine kinase [Candidatus Lokiarchaeum ossiferum]|uniref:Uridine kinase n=1 Tax=Candidatus Lokiarchaeum ossiferum TaxID=2951803 RepID=A0ABY6HL71_9ARCH|nr:Uridine kinase [Candidatus Lokiarchaeum sp. B-35]